MQLDITARPSDNALPILKRDIAQHLSHHGLTMPACPNPPKAPSNDVIDFETLPWRLVSVGYKKTGAQGVYHILSNSELRYHQLTWKSLITATTKECTALRRIPNTSGDWPLIFIGMHYAQHPYYAHLYIFLT